MWDVVFIRGRSVDAGAPLGLMGSSCVVGFTRVRAAGPCVHPGLLGSLGCALEVAGFIWDRCVHSCTPWVSLGSSGVALWYALAVVGFIRGRGVHSGAPWGSFGLSCVFRGNSDAPWGSFGSSGVAGFTHECPVCLWVHAGSLDSCAVVGYTRVRP